MKFILILTSLIFLTSFSIHGQVNKLGIKIGGSYTNVTDSETFDSKVFRKGFSGGVSYEYQFKNKIIIGADLTYAQRGFGNHYLMNIDPITGGKTEIIYYHYDYISMH